MVGTPVTRRTALDQFLAPVRPGVAAAVALAYAGGGIAWLLAGEWVIRLLIPEGNEPLVQLLRGVGFVAVTGLALYLVLGFALGRFAPVRPAAGGSLAAPRDRQSEVSEQRRLAHRLMQAEEDTRRSVAKDLHDGPLQALTLTFMQLDATARAAEQGETITPQRVTDSMNAIREAAEDIRAVVRALHPPLLAELGLAAAVERHCRESAMRAGRDVLFQGASMLPVLDSQSSIAVFRILQESLANALKHTREGAIRVSLLAEDGGVLLRVQDDGPGFVPAAAVGAGLGLLSMRERAESVGATFLLDSSPARGTTVQMHIPVPRADA